MLDQQGYMKLVDFGLAKRLDATEKTFTLCGTPFYMSPEAISQKGYGFECDVWALGIVFFEIACGALPFGTGCDDPLEVLADVVDCPLEFPSSYNDQAGIKCIQALLCK